jgi:exodeoxyribonuclease V alpha subunit
MILGRSQELIGRFLGESFVFDNGPDRRTIIGALACESDTHTIRGLADEGKIAVGMTYRFMGSFVEHQKYGRQFSFNSFAEQKPEGPEAIVGYLRRASGENGGITERVARLIWGKCGENSIDMLLANPKLVAEGIPQWGEEKAKRAAEYLKGFESERRVRTELINLLDGQRLPRKTIDRAIKRWGTAAASVVSKDPYELMKLPGIGFKSADKLFLELALQEHGRGEAYDLAISGIKRQAMCAAYEQRVMCGASGAVWVESAMLFGAIRRNFGIARCRPEEAVEFAERAGVLKSYPDNGKSWIASWFEARDEDDITDVVVSFLESDDEIGWPEASELPSTLSESQKAAMDIVTNSRLAILKGGPGTGKTFCLAGLVKAIIQAHGTSCVAIAAPTAKAAARVAETLRGYDIEGIWSGTIHGLLGVISADGGWDFVHGTTNPLRQQFIIIDESSMPDLGLMASLLRALSVRSHLLLVGDEEQIPPVGSGTPFVDLQPVLPIASLTEIRRNSGDIVRVCKLIREEGRIEFSPQLDEANGHNLPLYHAVEGDIADVVENLVEAIRSQVDPVWDCQVITPCNKGSLHSRRELNLRLQQQLNPTGERVKGNPFRVGDKVICLKNGDYQTGKKIEMPDGKQQAETCRVANGELGRVDAIEGGRMFVTLFYPDRQVVVPVQAAKQDEEERVGDSDDSDDGSKGLVGDWDLAYAISIHKSQGSQWKYVIFVIDPTSRASRLMSRQLVYTAISRAQNATLCVGEAHVAQKAIRRDGLAGRKTFLTQKIRAALDVRKGTLFQDEAEVDFDPLDGFDPLAGLEL